MQHTFILLLRWPGGENDGGGKIPENNEVKATDLQPDATEIPKEKDFGEKVKEALQDWSNDDQEDQDIDDATP